MRFYFKYDKLINHPGTVCDGVLPMKVKDEVVLAPWAYAIVIPGELQSSLAKSVPENLADKVIYIENDCKDIWDWSEKVYCAIEQF